MQPQNKIIPSKLELYKYVFRIYLRPSGEMCHYKVLSVVTPNLST